MKKFIKVLFTFFFISGITCAFAQEINNSELEQVQYSEEETSGDAELVLSLNDTSEEQGSDLAESFTFEDLDDIFENSTDTDAIVVEQPVNTDVEEKRGIIFTGNLYTVLGGYIYFDPFKMNPGVKFDSKISFSSRPSDYFSIHGTLLASFPEMQVGLYELYINYSLWDFAYLMAGKKELTWGNARIFDTNILDDSNDYTYDPEKLLYDDVIDIEKSKFSVMLSVPIKNFNVVGIADYKNFSGAEIDVSNPDIDKIMGDLSYSAMVEGTLKNISFDVFYKWWANNDPNRFDPAVGLDANFQLVDFHFYGQYVAHLRQDENNSIFCPRMKTTGSVWWATKEKVKLGFILEYQMIFECFDYKNNVYLDSDDYFKHYLAFEGVWARINGTPFTVAVKYFHDFHEGYGTIVPGVKIHDILPYCDFDIGIPIYYGSQQKVGIAVQAKLDVDF